MSNLEINWLDNMPKACPYIQVILAQPPAFRGFATSAELAKVAIKTVSCLDKGKEFTNKTRPKSFNIGNPARRAVELGPAQIQGRAYLYLLQRVLCLITRLGIIRFSFRI